MSPRARVWPPIGIAVGAAGILVGVGYAVVARLPGWEGHVLWSGLVVVPLYVVAVWLVRLRPDHPQAHRLLLMAASSATGIAVESIVRGAYVPGSSPDWFWAANLVHQCTYVLTVVAAGVLLATYPDGVVDRAWQRVAVRLTWWFLALPPLLLVTRPDLVVSQYLLESAPPPVVASPVHVAPLAAAGPALEVLFLSSAPVVLGAALLVVRFVQADREHRRHMRLLMSTMVLGAPLLVAAVVMTVTDVAFDSFWFQLVGLLLIPVGLMIPVSIVVGVLRYRLFDVDLVVRRSMAYGVLAVAIAGVYAGLTAAPGLALGDQVPVRLAVAVTVLAAVAFHPLRSQLESLADRWVFGEQVNRYQLLTGFGASLEQTVDLTELLPRLATTVSQGLGASWVRVRLRGDRPGAWLDVPQGVEGTPSGPPDLAEELRHADEVVGRIECGPREGGFDDADRELLCTLAGQAATAIANVRLAARLSEQVGELARSRARIVAAQDSERRRIERDIHDGVQQGVVALLAKVRLLRNQLARGETADAVLAELQSEAGELLRDLRELAHGIHPPVLSDGGLVAAVEARAGRLPLEVTVRADEPLRVRRLGPDVEAAAYFMVCEALTNVVKHAHAGGALVDIAAVDGHVRLDVSDDGDGCVAPETGQGLTNLRDRIEALGGRFEVEFRPGAGTRVSADLPVGVSHA